MSEDKRTLLVRFIEMVSIKQYYLQCNGYKNEIEIRLDRALKRSNVMPIKKLKTSKSHGQLVVAVDSTGLSLYSGRQWNRIKYHSQKTSCFEKWRKLHIAIDVNTGEILGSIYGKSTANDVEVLLSLLDTIEDPISAVRGDMAYDTVNCREAIKKKKAKQLILPIRNVRLTRNNRNLTKQQGILQERDEAIKYINHNTINGNKSLARASWKKTVECIGKASCIRSSSPKLI